MDQIHNKHQENIMPRKKTTKTGTKTRSVESYTHEGKDRLNNPSVGLVTPDTDRNEGRKEGRKTYQYDPHLDPQLIWAGKAEHTSFEVLRFPCMSMSELILGVLS
jgi:adenine-specific DNA-methyltransferase